MLAKSGLLAARDTVTRIDGTHTQAERTGAAPEARAARRVPVLVSTQPYGTLVLPDGTRTEEDTARHPLLLAPGRHALKVLCKHCEETVRELVVSPDGPREFKFQVQPLPARLTFLFKPAEAVVHIVGTELTQLARDTAVQALQVPLPPGQLRTRVEYQVTLPGFRTFRREVELSAGAATTEVGELEPE